MKEYWRDPTDGVVHKILTCEIPNAAYPQYPREQYIVLHGDEEIWLDDEDVFDEDDREEPLTAEERWVNECDRRYTQTEDMKLLGEWRACPFG